MSGVQGMEVEFDEENRCWHLTTSSESVLGVWFSIFFDEYEFDAIESVFVLKERGAEIAFINGLHPKDALLLEIEFERARK